MKETEENLKQKRMKQKEKVENLQRNKKEHGITLIALVVTIVVLLILAGITINMLFSNGGIFKVAQDAANAWNQAVINEQADLDNLTEQIQNLVNGQVGGGTEDPEDPTKGPNGKPLVDTVTEIQTEDNLEAEDTYGNVVTVPKGFKVVTSEGTTVPEGIVIEDENGNQFVWIPVGTVHKDNNPANDVTIKLGRYTFDESNGTPALQQAALAEDNLSNPEQTYENDVTISLYYHELKEYREGNIDSANRTYDLNATAKSLEAFVQSVENNGGYYIARYEASYGSGSGTADWKPLSKISTGIPRTSRSTQLEQGMLWNWVTQLDASRISQNMYQAGDTTVGVESDLINSYAWDTAIVFIQSMNSANSNYANVNYAITGTGSLINTGTSEDEVCNIFDMAANVLEWSTEYSTNIPSTYAYPCTYRGGYYNDIYSFTAYRNSDNTEFSDSSIGFRVLLYIK